MEYKKQISGIMKLSNNGNLEQLALYATYKKSSFEMFFNI